MVERVQVLTRCVVATADPRGADGPARGQRSMAALAVAYVVILYAMLSDHVDAGAAPVVYGLVLALPQLARRRSIFAVACGVLAGLVLVAGALLAEGGPFVFWPAALPLLLAVVRIPERWAWFLTPIALSVVTALVGVGAYVVSLSAQTW